VHTHKTDLLLLPPPTPPRSQEMNELSSEGKIHMAIAMTHLKRAQWVEEWPRPGVTVPELEQSLLTFFQEARAALDKAWPAFAEGKDRQGEANASQSLGAVCMRLGEIAAAKEALEAALYIYQDISDPASEQVCLTALRMIMEREGELEGMPLFGEGGYTSFTEGRAAEQAAEEKEQKEKEDAKAAEEAAAAAEKAEKAAADGVELAPPPAAAEEKAEEGRSPPAAPQRLSIKQLSQQQRSDQKKANTLFVLGNMRLRDGDPAGALKALGLSLLLYEGLDNLEARANCLQFLGVAKYQVLVACRCW
jgi:tetratricopeptide (TPR) repeat protein